jgi:hypothetical protein
MFGTHSNAKNSFLLKSSLVIKQINKIVTFLDKNSTDEHHGQAEA